MIRLDVMLERFPWCEMMELVVVKEGEVVMGLGGKVKVRVRWEGGGSIRDLFRAAKELKVEKAETGCGIGENPINILRNNNAMIIINQDQDNDNTRQ